MIEVQKGGLFTTVQDYPGRVGYWHVGIPPSGPMDSLAFRMANILVGNDDGTAGLEITALGPKLAFTNNALVALTGAVFRATLNGTPVPWWESVLVRAGSVLALGRLEGSGTRCYLAVRGGLDVPIYLGSRSTFPFGGLGGHEGRILRTGDVLMIGPGGGALDRLAGRRTPEHLIPRYGNLWQVRAIPGPHEAPDFFTPADVEMFYDTAWKVHYNSNRLGYRLAGPAPRFARPDGGEGGSHPSNIHDCAYAIGTINFTGDIPIILMVDGPSLGGFVSIATVISADLWRIGQAQANDVIRFQRTTIAEALRIRRQQNEALRRLREEVAPGLNA